MPMKARVVLNNLRKKGFREQRDRDHIWLILLSEDGLETEIRTKISHHMGDINDGLMCTMGKQIHLKRDDFQKFATCMISEKDYRSMLEDKSYT